MLLECISCHAMYLVQSNVYFKFLRLDLLGSVVFIIRPYDDCQESCIASLAVLKIVIVVTAFSLS